MPINRSSFPKGLEEGIGTWFGMAYEDKKKECEMIYDKEPLSKAWEEDVQMVGLGPAGRKYEGVRVNMDQGSEGWGYRYVTKEYGLGFPITHQAIRDHLYESLAPKYARALARSYHETEEIEAVAPFNLGFTSFNTGDGVTFFNTAHPSPAGTWSNRLTTLANLSEAAVEALTIQISYAEDDRGIPITLMPKTIVTSPTNKYVYERLFMSERRSGTDYNDVNAFKSLDMFQKPPATLTRLSDVNAWFIQTDVDDGMKHRVREELRKGTDEDKLAEVYYYMVFGSFVFGVTDPRCMYAGQGT